MLHALLPRVVTSSQEIFQIKKRNGFFNIAYLHGKEVIIGYIGIKEDHVISATDEKKSISATGPDGFPAVLLKTSKNSFAKPLHILLQSYFSFCVW